MKEIHVQTLTRESFSPYGEFVDVSKYGKKGKSAFFADLITWKPLEEVGISIGYANPDERRIPWYEYHAHTEEIRMPLDGDMIVYLGKQDENPNPETFEAFLVPQFTMIRLFPGVVHGRQFPAGSEPVHVLLLCEAATYANDVHHWDLPREEAPAILWNQEK